MTDLALVVVADADSEATLTLLARLLGPHKETLRKLMDVKKCKTRSQLLGLGIGKEDLQ